MKSKSIVVASALLLSLAAHADTILSYTFDPGSFFDLSSDNAYAATGTFDYDVTTGQVINIGYIALQTASGPAGPFVFTAATTVSPTDVIFTGDGDGDEDEYFFSGSLASGGTLQITGASYLGSEISGGGSVTAPVPEPAGWALMLAGLATMGRLLRRRQGASAR